MKKIFVLLMLAALLCSPALAANPDRDIIIIYTNDVHCAVDENIGYAGLAYYYDEVKKTSPYVTLIDDGDWAQGGTIGTISQGRYVLEIMNALGYDLAVPGNHEFDYGWGQFESYLRNFKGEFISCNLRDVRTGELILKPYKIIQYGDVKVAFVGACTPETIVKSTPSAFMDENGKYIYDFDGDLTGEKLCASIQKAVNDARAEGADFVVVAGHLGEYEDVTEVWAAPYVVSKTRGIDVFIDGHSHEITPRLMLKNLDGKEIPITQSGTKFHNIGRVVIKTNGEISTELVSSVEGKDEKISKLINEIEARYKDTLNEHLSYTRFDLRAMDDAGDWILRNSETNLCDLVTDALMHSSIPTKSGKADIALYNAGGMRANIMTGEIKFSNALAVLPFNNTVCMSEVSGQTILDELEHGARLMPKNGGGFLHVAGMTYTIDVSVPTPVIVDGKNMLIGFSEGPRRIKDAKVNGEPLDPEKNYKVVSINYVLRENGDGHRFIGAKLIEPDYAVASDVFARYIKTFDILPEIYGKAQGRIKIIGGNK